MDFIKEIDPNGQRNILGLPDFKEMFRHTYKDDLFIAEIFQVWSAKDDYSYSITLNFDIKKEITNSLGKKKYKSLKLTKVIVEKIITLLHQSNKEKQIWIVKGIMLGFTDLEEMQHLKEPGT